MRSWLASTPEDFRFSVKGQRGATMRALMTDAPGSVEWLVESIRPFGERLGAVLYRIPENVVRNDERLAALLAAWPQDVPLTMEFQDPSWLVDEVLDALRAHGATLCATELDESPEPPSIHLTGPYLYVRLRRTSYADQEIDAWAARLTPFLVAGHDAFALFRHDETGEGPIRALALQAAVERLLSAPDSPPPARTPPAAATLR